MVPALETPPAPTVRVQVPIFWNVAPDTMSNVPFVVMLFVGVTAPAVFEIVRLFMINGRAAPVTCAATPSNVQLVPTLKTLAAVMLPLTPDVEPIFTFAPAAVASWEPLTTADGPISSVPLVATSNVLPAAPPSERIELP
jgi:hypothetical protein